jgi:Zn-dependent protease
MIGSTYSYTYSPTRPAVRRVSTSRRELTQITIAYLVITFDLTLLYGGVSVLDGSSPLYSVTLPIVATAATAALTGFVLHEVAHKVAAQRRGYWAEFRMAPMWLLLSIVTAFIGFLWAAPGATVVNGMSDVREWGRTALAGPMTNFVFGVVFYAAAAGAFLAHSDFTPYILLLAYVNGVFATFNLIPYGPLDGHKVLTWDREVWAGAIVIAAALTVVSALALYGVITPTFHR